MKSPFSLKNEPKFIWVIKQICVITLIWPPKWKSSSKLLDKFWNTFSTEKWFFLSLSGSSKNIMKKVSQCEILFQSTFFFTMMCSRIFPFLNEMKFCLSRFHTYSKLMVLGTFNSEITSLIPKWNLLSSWKEKFISFECSCKFAFHCSFGYYSLQSFCAHYTRQQNDPFFQSTLIHVQNCWYHVRPILTSVLGEDNFLFHLKKETHLNVVIKQICVLTLSCQSSFKYQAKFLWHWTLRK